MMRFAATIISTVLGLAFIAFALMFFFHVGGGDRPAEGSPAAMFMGAIYPTGYLHVVKVLELISGILLLIPAMRRLGLLILGPIVVNILLFNGLIAQPRNVFDPMLIVIVGMIFFLVWSDRRAWWQFVKGSPA